MRVYCRVQSCKLRTKMRQVMEATVQAGEESIVNALCAAETTVGRHGSVAYALPHDRLREILEKYNRLEDTG